MSTKDTIQVRLDCKAHKKLKVYAAKKGVTLSEAIIRLFASNGTA